MKLLTHVIIETTVTSCEYNLSFSCNGSYKYVFKDLIMEPKYTYANGALNVSTLVRKSHRPKWIHLIPEYNN